MVTVIGGLSETEFTWGAVPQEIIIMGTPKRVIVNPPQQGIIELVREMSKTFMMSHGTQWSSDINYTGKGSLLVSIKEGEHN